MQFDKSETTMWPFALLMLYLAHYTNIYSTLDMDLDAAWQSQYTALALLPLAEGPKILPSSFYNV